MSPSIADQPSDDTADYSWAGEECRDGHRRTLTACLQEIAAEVTVALADAGLSGIPIYLAVPSGGPSLMTYATPVDPTDETWERMCKIVCAIVGSKIDLKVSAQEMPCASAGITVSVADVLLDNAPDYCNSMP
jgi:hypothetical protein